MKTDLIATCVIPMLGDPVAQVATPRLWNALFAQAELDAVCIPIDLPAEGIAAFVSWVRLARNIPGFLTTTPHKAELARACDYLMPDATFLNAVNTVRCDPNGKLTGDMFDGHGMLDAIVASGTTLTGATVAICGAGAAGSAIALQAIRRGVAQILVYDQNVARSEDLIGRLANLGHAKVTTGIPERADILINASYAGSRNAQPAPFSDQVISSAFCVADALTNPVETDLIRRARAANIHTITGLDMAAHQALAMRQFLGFSI